MGAGAGPDWRGVVSIGEDRRTFLVFEDLIREYFRRRVGHRLKRIF
jgi:hypothetical protein